MGDAQATEFRIPLPHPEKKHFYRFVHYFKHGNPNFLEKKYFCPETFVNADFLGCDAILEIMKKHFRNGNAFKLTQVNEFTDSLAECHFRSLVNGQVFVQGGKLTDFGKALKHWLTAQDHSPWYIGPL